MKKIKFLPFVLAIFLLGACSSTKEAEIDAAKKENEVAESSKKTNESNKKSIGVDKGILNVEVTLPATLFEDQDIDSVIAKAKEDGVSEVTRNDDGSLTYKMSKSKHEEMMKELRDGLLQTIEEAKSSGDFASIKDITHNKSFSEFTLVVDQEAYEKSFDGFVSIGLAVSATYYQLFDGVNPDNYKVTIFIKNADTGEVFKTIDYPDALNE